MRNVRRTGVGVGEDLFDHTFGQRHTLKEGEASANG